MSKKKNKKKSTGKKSSKLQQLRYLNRELSWLDFNFRVLSEAQLQENALLDRLKFLAITAGNLDEFFKVRVGGLKILNQVSPDKTEISGLTPSGQLLAIESRVRELYQEQYSCLLGELEPRMKKEEICRLEMNELSPEQLEFIHGKFHEHLAPALSPILIDSNSDFPLLTTAKICVCVDLETDPGQSLTLIEESESRFALVPVGPGLDRFHSVPSPIGYRFVTIESIVEYYLEHFFPGQKIVDSTSFRVTRNADMTFDEDSVSDLLSGMTDMLTARRISDCVRLEVSKGASQEITGFLKQSLEIDDQDVFECEGPIDLSEFMSLTRLEGFESLREKAWAPLDSPEFPAGSDIFEIIAEEDRCLVHPYESYDPVANFVRAAASDPQVISIKQILYRTSGQSAIVKALADAAGNGKNVTVIVELKARFDEERNIQWARFLEQAGVDVIYGVRGLKTHAKVCIVVRREPSGIKRYMHFGTGNYNETTARIYSDISLLTCDDQLGADAVTIFNSITGLSVPLGTRSLSFSPLDIRSTFEELIDSEIEAAKQGGKARIEAKFNSLTDERMIDHLYKASQVGVKVRLNIRGICCLIPGVDGLSDNIKVNSIVDRNLEHARLFYFHNRGEHKLFFGSADWMTRNLDRRVELLIPVESPAIKNRLIAMLKCYFQDNVRSHVLGPDGTYQRQSGSKPFRSQFEIYQSIKELHGTQRHQQATLFQPHRAAVEE